MKPGIPAAVILCYAAFFAADRFEDAAARRASPTTVIVVRHADRDGQNDALTPGGSARAHELVHVASKAGVSAIYCTKTVRTRKTAEPLAAKLGLTVPATDDPARFMQSF